MPGYFSNFIFGGAKVDFKSTSTASAVYLGAVFASGDQKKTSAATAKGIDFGDDDYFKNRAVIKINRIDKFKDENLESLTFEFYTSKDNADFTKQAGSMTISKEKLNESGQSQPFYMTVPCNFDRYVCLGVKFNKKASQTLDTITSGSIMAVLTDPKY